MTDLFLATVNPGTLFFLITSTIAGVALVRHCLLKMGAITTQASRDGRRATGQLKTAFEEEGFFKVLKRVKEETGEEIKYKVGRAPFTADAPRLSKKERAALRKRRKK